MSKPMAISASDRVAALSALSIPQPSAAAVQAAKAHRAAQKLRAAASTGGQADVDSGSLVAFTAGVSADHTSAALNSTLLAAMNSDTLYDRNDASQVLNWYANYVKILQICGWDSQAFGFQTYQASGSSFSINNAIIEIVTAAVAGGPEVAVVEAALDALKNLSTDDPWYVIWDSHTHSTSGGNFQIVPVTDSNGARNTLAMSCSAFTFTTSETTTEFLWTNYNSSSVTLKYGTQTMTLDEDIWDQVSTTVITKLGNNANTQIGNLNI